MAKVFQIDDIRSAAEAMDLTSVIEAGFVAYSDGKVVVPPVGELLFAQPPGDTHIKYGYIHNDEIFVIKIASGFYDNPSIGLPSGSGLMLVFSQKTGFLQSILLDDGYLTNIRTALAGRIAARYLAPRTVNAIGIYGTGAMARLQLTYLASETDCREVVVWGRSEEGLDRYCEDISALGYSVTPTRKSSDVTDACNVIVTTTPSVQPLIIASQVRPGTHITAVGSDTPEKQELDGRILGIAKVVIADSIEQCRSRGEIFHAIREGHLSENGVLELGNVIKSGAKARASESDITVADLTGVAVQDIQIAKAVCERLLSPSA
ncbi:ornithine cyclodeaminase family protein [Brucella cytisi]|uniref:Ornithine cyclodeaminase family protein n=1 Tax=Brucella cytisi TaxID=407152 RepID=A0A1J6I1T9_9HYPH|nr:ornithine cyclodeaminase family protein [Brucella cytisi]OIS92850.1 ornithine cyclodeaminase family protein [Brucella cytisi]